MTHAAQSRDWYIAEIIYELSIEGASENVVHIELRLIHAHSAEEAFQKSGDLGLAGNDSYTNPDGKQVRIQFHGLRDLFRVHDPLEDGSELLFEERFGVDREELKNMLTAKEELAVFATRQPRIGPDYTSKEIVDKIREITGD